VACSSSFSLKLFVLMVSRESNNTPVALEPLLQMHAMGHQSRQNRHGGGGGTSFFLSLV
jgi:hypothetical protein